MGALKLRSAEEHLLKTLIQKKKSDKCFFDTRRIELKQSKKAKIDSYVVKKLSKDEKEWSEELVSLKVELKSLNSFTSGHKVVDNDIINSIFNKVLSKYEC